MRVSQIWLTLGVQSPHQLDDQLQQTVLSLGTYIIGQAATMAGARLLADALFLRDPWRVKYWRPGGYEPRSRWASSRPKGDELAVEPEFLPLDEQTEVFATRIRKLKQYQFLVRPAVSEGEVSTNVLPIDISTVTADPVTGTQQFPDQELMAELKSRLAAAAGRPIGELLQEQETSLARYTQVVEGQLRPLPITRWPTHTRPPAATPTDSVQPVVPAAASARQSTSGVQPSANEASATAPGGTRERQRSRRVRVS
jgi:hypothetical protein